MKTNHRRPTILAATALSIAAWAYACGDATDVPTGPEPEPEPPPVQCAQGEFTLRNSAGTDRCVTLPTASISYIDALGRPSDEATGITNHAIKVSFDAAIAYMHPTEGWKPLASAVPPDMFEITTGDGRDLLDLGFEYDMAIGADDAGTFFTVKAQRAYPVGDIDVVVKNFAKLADADQISRSDNAAAYLSEARAEFSFAAVKMESACTRGEEGYFEWTHDSGLYSGMYECVTLPEVRYTFTPSEGAESAEPNGDPTATIRIRFDSEVAFLNDSGDWSEVTNDNLLDMVEIRLGGEGEDLVRPDGPIGPNRVSVSHEDGRTVATLEPPNGASYPPGEYTATVANYVRTEDAPWIAEANNTDAYLGSIGSAVSFSTVDRDVLCAREEAGFFRLDNADGTHECLRLPDVRYTFTASGGRELDLPSGHYTTTIRIYFSSEVVYLDDAGDWSEITESSILDMVELRGNTDIVSPSGPIDADQVSVDQIGGTTVITIDPPDGRYYSYPLDQNPNRNYYLSVANYAKRSDVSRITMSGSLAEYSNATRTVYSDDYGGFIVRGRPFCDYMPSSTTSSDLVPPPVVNGVYSVFDDIEYVDDIYYEATSGVASPDLGGGNGLPPMNQTRADPDRTYVIDVGFVVSTRRSMHDVRSRVEHAMPYVNAVFQSSGVNVEFRSKVVPFSDYRDYLLCPVDFEDTTIAGVRWASPSIILSELAPRIQKDHNVDLIYGVLGEYVQNGDTVGFLAAASTPGSTSLATHQLQYAATGYFGRHFLLPGVIAHEIGHNLGLQHDRKNLGEGWYPHPYIFHPKGYGFRGTTEDGRTYGTIMSYERAKLPVFSADKTRWRSELCGLAYAHDGFYSVVFNDEYYKTEGFCFASDSLPDERIRLGGLTSNGVIVDASEALLYAIDDVSSYSSSGMRR